MDLAWTPARVLLHALIVWTSASAGQIRCDCNTPECREAGRTTCLALKSCYTEIYQSSLSRGCDPAPLACENRRPAAAVGVEWPAVYCCSHKDLCNRLAVPTLATSESSAELQPTHPEEPPPTPPFTNCSSLPSSARGSGLTRSINPIYIAVPVAGVCVLLGLIIFAMYLLRRRVDFHHHHHHDDFHHFRGTQAPELGQKPVVAPHHCQCLCRTEPNCSKGNRCTDSERSSSGSETKLFLQS